MAEKVAYSFKTGLVKSIKNTIVVLLPALAAGWLAFTQNVPQEYNLYITIAGGFLAYLVKNYIQNK